MGLIGCPWSGWGSGRVRGNDTIGFSFHAWKDRWRGVNAPEKLSWLRLCTQEPTTYLDDASSLLWLFRLNSTSPVAIPAAALAAQTLFVQIGPVPPGVVDGDLLACLDSFGNQNDPLHAQPGEFLELAVRVAGVVDESRVVALTSLPDLICLPVRLALHDVHVTQAPRNQSNKFPYRCAPFERLGGVRKEKEIFEGKETLTQQAMSPLLRPFGVRNTWTGHGFFGPP